jgi:hypothetical protein
MPAFARLYKDWRRHSGAIADATEMQSHGEPGWKITGKDITAAEIKDYQAWRTGRRICVG